MYRRNASASTADPTAATELVLFATNDGDLYAGQGKSIITNLAKKMAKGQYVPLAAAKLWGYFADSAAQKYAWEFGSRKPGTRSWHQQGKDGNGMFNAATRRMAASEIEDRFREEVQHEAASVKPARSARKNGTRMDVLREDARKSGYAVETYSPGDGVTRYRFFSLAEMAQKGVSEREQSYFGPLNGVHTALGLAAAKKWLARAPSVRRNGGQTYNGHPSRAHWNVALWVGNDYGLYQAVSRMGKAEAVEYLMHSFPRTPDGVKMTKTLAAYAWRSLHD